MLKFFQFVLFSLTLYSVQAQNKNIIVCPNCPINRIKSALNKAQKNDTLIIQAGKYNEFDIDINQPVVLKGIGFPIIDVQYKGKGFTLNADSITISGLQIQNIEVDHLEDKAAIRINKRRHFHIVNNKILNSFFGIYAANSSSGIITHNVVIGKAVSQAYSGNAVHLWYCTDIQVVNNQLKRHRDGIYFEFVSQSIISDNVSENNLRYGLHFMFSNDNTYLKNIFRQNGAGVAVMFSKNIRMIKNIFIHNWGTSSYGLLLKEIYDADLLDNHFERNTIGIYTESSTRINYLRNNFTSNGWAIKMTGSCIDNAIHSNNFLYNTFDISLVGTNTFQNTSNTLKKNYWSKYRGYDLNKDGIGDIPYQPCTLFSYIVLKFPESTILLRSLFIALMNFSETINPIFIPDLTDETPLIYELPLAFSKEKN